MLDPFRERPPAISRRRVRILGADFIFTSDSARLMRLVDAAYARLPRDRFTAATAQFQIHLTLDSGGPKRALAAPVPHTRAGAGLICGAMNAHNFAVLHPESRRALISISRAMLRFPYHVRYELMEFAVFTLVSRAQGLVPLHAACVGSNGRALLVLGDSGTGKSTLTLQCMLQGMALLAEDAVFVAPHTLLAAGVPNFLHLRRDSLRFVGSREVARFVRTSAVIERRSGVRKYEVDVRGGNFAIAKRPLEVAGVIFLTRRSQRTHLLTPLSHAEGMRRLVSQQGYAAGLESWKPFADRLRNVPKFELARPRHPADGARALSHLLEWR